MKKILWEGMNIKASSKMTNFKEKENLRQKIARIPMLVISRQTNPIVNEKKFSIPQ